MNICLLAAITLLSVCALSNARVQITRLSKYHQLHAIVLTTTTHIIIIITIITIVVIVVIIIIIVIIRVLILKLHLACRIATEGRPLYSRPNIVVNSVLEIAKT